MSNYEQNHAIEGSVAGSVCIPNISLRERRRRLIGGITQFAVTLTILTTLIVRGANRWWRLPLLLMFWGAGSGVFQWRDQTCVGLAIRGTRRLNDDMEQIEDTSELAQVRRQARTVTLKALLAAIPLTVIALLLPERSR